MEWEFFILSTDEISLKINLIFNYFQLPSGRKREYIHLVAFTIDCISNDLKMRLNFREIIMDDSTSMDDIKAQLRLLATKVNTLAKIIQAGREYTEEYDNGLCALANKVDALSKITDGCCEYLGEKDCEFERILEIKLLNILKDGA